MPRATPPFTIETCTAADGPALARNNIPAFFTIKNWSLLWTRVNKTCEYVTSQAALRWGYNVLKDPARGRYQKAVDANGQLVGYCKWVLPAGAGEELWPEAKVARVSEEEEKRIKAEFDSADWKFDHSFDVLDDPQDEMEQRLLGKKNYLRESKRS